jgi:hypothetical protein
MLDPLFCSEAVMERLVAQVRQRLVQLRNERAQERETADRLRTQLAEAEAEIARLVEWIAKGTLVDDLERRMLAAKEHREHLQRELARQSIVETPPELALLPGPCARSSPTYGACWRRARWSG